MGSASDFRFRPMFPNSSSPGLFLIHSAPFSALKVNLTLDPV